MSSAQAGSRLSGALIRTTTRVSGFLTDCANVVPARQSATSTHTPANSHEPGRLIRIYPLPPVFTRLRTATSYPFDPWHSCRDEGTPLGGAAGPHGSPPHRWHPGTDREPFVLSSPTRACASQANSNHRGDTILCGFDTTTTAGAIDRSSR